MTAQTHILDTANRRAKALLALPAFRARQLTQWVFEKGEANPQAMTNLPASLRAELPSLLDFSLPAITTEQKAADGVVKWLFRFADGQEAETVFIPEEHRGTLCVSSQVGCTLSCRFCHTGTQGLSRNLAAWEIVAQVWLARRQLEDFPAQNEARKITNIVFMGMGEPLMNPENVFPAIHTLMEDLGLGSRKITLSTSGVAPLIVRVGRELGVNLAISLHAPDDETRSRIMPINKKWPLAELMAAVRAFPLKEHRRVTWEYVMLSGVNDTPAHARRLIGLIEGIPSLVNLIPFNPWPGSPFACSTPEVMGDFKKLLKKAGLSVTLRKTRGEDILAACGQLRSETSNFNTISLQYPTVVAQYGNERQKEQLKVNITD